MVHDPEKITRYGAYGIIIHESKLLLTQKKSGPYKDLWGLPGGSIEFGETPEIALKREIQEETALSANDIGLLTVMTNYATYRYEGKEVQMHHIGIIYRVNSISLLQDVTPEEKKYWMHIHEPVPVELTPFATQALMHNFFENDSSFNKRSCCLGL